MLNGSKVIPGLDISGDIRWDLLDILSRNDAADIAALLATASAADPSDYGAKRALKVQAAQPDAALKAKWLKELQSPRELEGLAKSLEAFVGTCDATCAGGAGPDCTILDDLSKAPKRCGCETGSVRA